jgi:hypothetical protein
MTRTSFMNWQIALAWIAFGLYAQSTHAEILVGDFATVDATSTTWRRAADAKLVRRLRGSDIAVVPVAELLPTDRVLACDDPLVQADTIAKCTTVQPDTKNNWRLVAVVFPQPPPPAQKFTDIAVTWTYKPDANSAPLSELTGYRLQLKLQQCDPSHAGCPAAGYGTPIDLGVVNSYSTAVPGEMHEVCASVQALKAEVAGAYAEKCSERGSMPGAVEIAVEFTGR